MVGDSAQGKISRGTLGDPAGWGRATDLNGPREYITEGRLSRESERPVRARKRGNAPWSKGALLEACFCKRREKNRLGETPLRGLGQPQEGVTGNGEGAKTVGGSFLAETEAGPTAKQASRACECLWVRVFRRAGCREIRLSGSTRGEWVAPQGSPSLLFYRLCGFARNDLCHQPESLWDRNPTVEESALDKISCHNPYGPVQ